MSHAFKEMDDAGILPGRGTLPPCVIRPRAGLIPTPMAQSATTKHENCPRCCGTPSCGERREPAFVGNIWGWGSGGRAFCKSIIDLTQVELPVTVELATAPARVPEGPPKIAGRSIAGQANRTSGLPVSPAGTADFRSEQAHLSAVPPGLKERPYLGPQFPGDESAGYYRSPLWGSGSRRASSRTLHD